MNAVSFVPKGLGGSNKFDGEEKRSTVEAKAEIVNNASVTERNKSDNAAPVNKNLPSKKVEEKPIVEEKIVKKVEEYKIIKDYFRLNNNDHGKGKKLYDLEYLMKFRNVKSNSNLSGKSRKRTN